MNEFTENRPTLTPEEILKNMESLSQDYESVAPKLLKGYADRKKQMAKIRLYIENGMVEFLSNDIVIRRVKKANETDDKGKSISANKLTLDTIEACISLELEDAQFEYQEAVKEAETITQAYEMFAKQLSWYQSVMKKENTEMMALQR